MKIKNNTVAVLALITALLISGSVIARAQEISFPVPELGNCGSKNECRVYCNDPAHMDACISFARAHGLMNKEEADRASGFKKALEQGGGPGGCTTPIACKSFCEQIEHIDACIAFAKKSGVSDKEIQQGERVNDYLKSGGTMPGGCTSRGSCDQYCSDFSHTKECMRFARDANFNRGENSTSTTEENLNVMSQLIQNGETPGKCKSKDECEVYCEDRSHFTECTAFAEKAGFIKPREAEKIKQFKAQGGPGGCNSKESCTLYCNSATHREECLKFAQDRGLEQDKNISTSSAPCAGSPFPEDCIKSFMQKKDDQTQIQRPENPMSPQEFRRKTPPPPVRPQGIKYNPSFLGAVLNSLGKFLGIRAEVVSE